MNYIIAEIRGYMQFMTLEAAARKVSRSHLGQKEFLIHQAVEVIKQAA